MKTESYLAWAAKWMPRIIESMKEYHEAMDVLKTMAAIDQIDLDDASRMYIDLVEGLTKNYRSVKLHELQTAQAPDARIIVALREFKPTPDQELFERTGMTPGRWNEVLNGYPLDRLEVAILCHYFQVEPTLFTYSLKHNYVTGTKLKLIESALPEPQLVHLATKTKRPLPPGYLTIYWEDDDFGSAELKRTAPAWKYHIHAYIASHEDELLKEVFPDLIEKEKPADAEDD